MKQKLKHSIMMLSLVVLVIASAARTPVKAEAKVKNGTYDFVPAEVTKFEIKNNKLTLKIEKTKKSSGITKYKDEKFKAYELKVAVAKNCKYRWLALLRPSINTESGKTTYSEMKKWIKADRKFYKENGYSNNVVSSTITIKNNKVVKIVYGQG